MSTTSNGITLRKSLERGHANHGWLDSYHTFNFANYYDPKFDGFGCLRVINEDKVAPTQGFGTHPHREFEIFSYIISGELEHKDSMGNKEAIHREEVQFTSAGTGITHSEYNSNKEKTVHFIQIWVKPNISNLTPSYCTKKFTDEQKKAGWVKIVSPKGDENSILIHNDITMYATLIEKGKELKHHFEEGRKGYLHLVQTGGSITVNGVAMNSGDGAFINGITDLSIVGQSDQLAELLFFDMSATS